MKICFRLNHELVLKDTGKALLFKLPNSDDDTVWVPLFLTSRYGSKKFGFLIKADENFCFSVLKKNENVKMTPCDLLVKYNIPHDDNEADINEDIEERNNEIKCRLENEKQFFENHKNDVKNWNKVKVRLYNWEQVGMAVKMNVKGVEGAIMVPAKLVKIYNKTVQMPKWLADEKQIPEWAQESTIHTPDELDVVENQQPIKDVVID